MNAYNQRAIGPPAAWPAIVAAGVALCATAFAIAHPPEPVAEVMATPVQVTFVPAAIFVDGERVQRGSLRSRLQTLHAAEPARALVLRAEDGVHFGRLRETLHDCKDMGFTGVSLESR